MSTYDLFKDFVIKAAEKFKELDRRRLVRVISHIDSDGISAASIILFTLTHLGYRYSFTPVRQLDKDTIDMLAREDQKNYIFTDLGSGQLKSLVSKFSEKKVFILDHHHPQNAKLTSNIIHLNPMLFGIDGAFDISGAGVVYMFCRAIDEKAISMSHIAVVGAIGDRQEAFIGLNKEIIEEAVKNKTIKIQKGVRFFGRQTRPLHKLLEYTTDPYIPGVSGSHEGTLNFLKGLDIPFEVRGKKRKVIDLNENEMKRLIKGIIKKRNGEKNPKDIFGNIFIVQGEDSTSPLRDAKEFSTILNACGRLGKASLGIGVCMGNKKSKEKAIELMKSYRREILEAIRWYEKNKTGENVYQGNKILLINSKANIMSTIIGTLASILSFSKELKKYDYIMAMSQNVDSTTKISVRYTGKDNTKDVRILIKKVIKKVGGEAGGHRSAAGAIISTDKEKEFIESALEIFNEE